MNGNDEKINQEKEEKQENKDTQEWTNSILVFLSTKTGLNKHNDLYLPTIAKLLRFPQSIGILGIHVFQIFFLNLNKAEEILRAITF